METLTVLLLLAFGAHLLKSRDQGRRIALLGRHLQKHQIEHLMEHLITGYLRALGEVDPQRQAQLWAQLASAEQALCAQFSRFSASFSTLDGTHTRVSKLAFALPHADRLFPRATFDLRRALHISALGISAAVKNDAGLTPKRRAFDLMAELLLMQHTCHWFCRSKTLASARMLARHQTSYAQLLRALPPATRSAYLELLAGQDPSAT